MRAHLALIALLLPLAYAQTTAPVETVAPPANPPPSMGPVSQPVPTVIPPPKTDKDLPPQQAPLSNPNAPDATPANARQYAQIHSSSSTTTAMTYEYFITDGPVNYTPTPTAEGASVEANPRGGFAFIGAAAGVAGFWAVG